MRDSTVWLYWFHCTVQLVEELVGGQVSSLANDNKEHIIITSISIRLVFRALLSLPLLTSLFPLPPTSPPPTPTCEPFCVSSRWRCTSCWKLLEDSALFSFSSRAFSSRTCLQQKEIRNRQNPHINSAPM